MTYLLIQRYNKQWTRWVIADRLDKFIDILKYMNSSCSSEWYKNGFLVVQVEENTVTSIPAARFLIDHGLLEGAQ